MALVPYHEAIKQRGGSYIDPVPLKAYASRSYQRGYGLGTTVSGFFKTLVPYAKKAALNLGKSALSAGAAIAQDALHGKSIKESVKSNLKTAGTGFARDLLSEFAGKPQTGAGLDHINEPNETHPIDIPINIEKKRKTVKRKASSVRQAPIHSKKKKKVRHLKHGDIFDI